MTTSARPDTTTIVTTQLPTPAGDVCIATRGDCVVACGFSDHWDTLTGKIAPRFPGHAWTPGETGPSRALADYLDGELTALDSLAVDTGGTAFQRRVWEALRTIPVGQTWSYADLAVAVGSRTATRAVGSANGANPISLVVPCHRVVRSDGRLGGYGGGLDRKAWLLVHEGARLLG